MRQFIPIVFSILALGAYWGQVQGNVLPIDIFQGNVLPIDKSNELLTSTSTLSIDLIGSSRLKRSGGGGCGCCGCGGGGCGCGCCCRPKCCCRCCRTCCCTRCCTCCRPCCCGCGCGCGGGGGGCGCCGGCGCGCCGCGGGRKRRSLQNLKIDHLNQQLGIQRKLSKKNQQKC